MDRLLFADLDGISDLFWLLRNFGPLLIAVVFFVWRDYRREEKLTQRIQALEEEQRKVILPLVSKCTEVIAQNTSVMRDNTSVMSRLEHALNRGQI